MLAYLRPSADAESEHQSAISNSFPQLGSWVQRRTLLINVRLIALASVWCLPLGWASAHAVEFEVETAVYVGDNKEPVEERITVFKENKVIDFPIAGSSAIYVVDTVLNELTVIDEAKRQASKVAANQLVRFGVDQQTRIAKMPDALRDRLKPTLRATWDADQQQLDLTAKAFRYRATLYSPEIANQNIGETAEAYRKFTDWMARFNAMRPNAMPAPSRLKLNDEVAKLKLVPSKITKTIPAGSARTTHRFSGLQEKHDRRSQDIARMSTGFQSVDIHEFLTR